MFEPRISIGIFFPESHENQCLGGIAASCKGIVWQILVFLEFFPFNPYCLSSSSDLNWATGWGAVSNIDYAHTRRCISWPKYPSTCLMSYTVVFASESLAYSIVGISVNKIQDTYKMDLLVPTAGIILLTQRPEIFFYGRDISKNAQPCCLILNS